MTYFATKLSSYISAAVIAIGVVLELIAPLQPFLPHSVALYAGAIVTVLGGIKALLSGSILPAIQSLPITGTPPSSKS